MGESTDDSSIFTPAVGHEACITPFASGSREPGGGLGAIRDVIFSHAANQGAYVSVTSLLDSKFQPPGLHLVAGKSTAAIPSFPLMHDV